MKFRVPVYIQTKAGYNFAEAVKMDYCNAQKYGGMDTIKETIVKNLQDIEQTILHMLLDKGMIKKYKLDEFDTEGWKIYRELHDKYSILKHYSTR